MSEEREENLSPHAVRSRFSRGRLVPEEPDPVRTAFQRDRDRIIHSKSFRRLKHKTQVFIAPIGDHYVTRLTHTLEVAQIARTIARALNLNEDLSEAIAMGHDLGHTPFGHIGEEALNELYEGGFQHNEQSLRVVDVLENDGKGLNLTLEVRDGIISHSKSSVAVLGDEWGEVSTFEGETVKISDMVAYINHDIIDAMRAGLINENDIPVEAAGILGNSHSKRVNRMVTDIIEHSWDVRTGDTINERPAVRMGPEVLKAATILNNFLSEEFYTTASSQAETIQARKIVSALYEYFIRHENKMPEEYRLYRDTTERRVVDYIAGMTDQYAINLARELGLV